MKRLLILLLVFVLVAGACAPDEAAESPPTTQAVQAADQEAPEPAPPQEPPPPADAAPDADETSEQSDDEATTSDAEDSDASESESEATDDGETTEPAEEPGAEEAADSDEAAGEQAGDPAEINEAAADEQEPALDPTPLPVDPALRIGTLDNGLTYYLRTNKRPGTNLSLRLAVDAGAIHEDPPGLGVAHFLEHMMFNGTKQYARNEIVEALRSLGVEFGPDVNAFTSFDATVYELDVVTKQPGVVETAFSILSQWAQAATLAEADVIAERGVVRDELRLSDESARGIINQTFEAAYLAGSPYEGRPILGSAESIEAMTPAQLREFYEKWYVPSNMAIIAVGDLPLDELQDLVEEHFGYIPAAEAPPEPDTSSPLNPEPAYKVATAEGIGYSFVSLDLKIPTWDAATVGGERAQVLEGLVALILEARLGDAYEQGFLTQFDPAHWSAFDYGEGLRFYGTNLRADDLAASLGDFWSMMLSLAAAGFTAEDIQRAAEQLRSDLEFELEGVATIQDAHYSELYMTHFLEGADIGTVADRVERMGALLEDITSEEVTAHFRRIMRTSAPIVIAVGETPADVPTTDELRAAIEGATAGEVPERMAEVTSLMDAPEPVETTSEGRLDAFGRDAYEWQFANGATVVFVRTDISEGQVDLMAAGQGGWSTMEPGDNALAGTLATQAVAASGLAGLTPSQVQRLYDTENAVVFPLIDETEEGFFGTAATDGIETMFQSLHLLMTVPQIDDQAFADAMNIGEITIEQAETDPGFRARLAYLEARWGDDAFDWFTPVPTAEALAALSPESLLARYNERLGDVDDLIVAVVGDVDRATVERMARTYIGTLPAGEADTFVNRRSPEPDGVVVREVALPPGTRDTGLTIYYEAQRDVDVALEVAAEALTSILNARLVRQIREEIGATYSVGIAVVPYVTPEPGVLARVSVTGDPTYVEEIHETVFEILEDFADNGPTAGEWTEVRAVLRSEYTHVSNFDYLEAALRRAFTSDEDLPIAGRRVEELGKLEADDVQELAAALFDPDEHIDIVRVLADDANDANDDAA